MPTPAVNAQLRNAELGFRVQGAAKTVPQNATQTVFTVTGGRILVNLLYGLVTTVIAGTTPSARYIATPTVGTLNNMCANGVITAAEVGSHFVVPNTGGIATAMIVSTAGSGSSSAGAGYGGLIVAPGTIGFATTAADATGAVQHSLFYVPLDPAATVVAN